MRNSRRLEDLHVKVRAKAELFLGKCEAEGIDVLVTCTWRDDEAQDALYAQGRMRPGKIVTKARGGESFHQYKVAFDIVPLRNGKCVWGTKGEDKKLWVHLGELGESVGLEWAGRWKGFPEFPHFQFTGGLSIEDLKGGRRL